MIKCLIIDDEKPARELIRAFLKNYSEIEIIAEAENGFEGLKLIQEFQPDLLFLDIKMPKISGLEMLELVETKPVTIFSTAFDEFAIRAFELSAADYLLKPFTESRFSEAVNKAIQKIRDIGNYDIDIPKIKIDSGQPLSRIVVKNGGKIIIIDIEEILYLSAEDDYVSIVSSKGVFLKLATLSSFERDLSDNDFVRIHRSYIIRLNALDKIEPYSKETFRAKIKNGKSLPVSRSGYQRLKKALRL